MCENIFINQEEKKRKEEFSRLFAILVSNNASKSVQPKDSRKEKMVC